MLKIKSNDNKNPNYEKALKDIQQANLVLLSFLLPKSLRDSFKIKVVENKTTMVSVLTDYIEEYVENKKNAKLDEEPDEGTG